MTTSGADEEARRMIDLSQAALGSMTGSVLSFAALSRILKEQDRKKLALIIEKLASNDVHLLKPVYFLDDQEYGLLQLRDADVKFYVVHGLFHHPITNAEIGSDELDDSIVIEFEVL